jgi:hypothetical protein
MGRIADILTKARDSLSDASADRWSNDRLLRLVDEAQKDIAVRTNLLRRFYEVPIILHQNTYELPDEATDLIRALVANAATVATDTENPRAPIPIRSHSQMDDMDPDWEETQGDGIEYIIFDKQNARFFKIYPIPTVADAISDHTVDTDFGVTTTVSGDTISSVYGVVSGVTVSAVLTATFSSPFGVISEMQSYITSLKVYYYRKPATIDTYSAIDNTQHLEIEDTWDKAIKHYVVGMALRDDKDTQNRAIGNDELSLYEGQLKLAFAKSSKNHTQNEQRSVTYNDGFNL